MSVLCISLQSGENRSIKRESMKKLICTILSLTAMIFGLDAPISSQIPLSLNAIQTLNRNIETGTMEVSDVTSIPHYEFYDSTYDQQVILATHTHSEVVTDLAYYTVDGEWLEDIHRATPPNAEHVSKRSYDAAQNRVISSWDSKRYTSSGTENSSEDETIYYNTNGLIDSIDFTYEESGPSGTVAYTQKSIYHYDSNIEDKLLQIIAHREDTLYEENYSYVDTADMVKIHIDRKYTCEDSVWYEVKNPIEKYCRPLDTTTIVYKAADGTIDSHTQRKYNSDGTIYEEINFNINSGALHAKKTYRYTDEGYLEQIRLYKPNNEGVPTLQEEKNYDYGWSPEAIIKNTLVSTQKPGSFAIQQNSLQLILPKGESAGLLVVLDASGRQLMQEQVNKAETSLSLEELAQGVYIASFRKQGHTLNSFRFMR